MKSNKSHFLIYSLLAALIVGFHIFSFKYLDILLKKGGGNGKNVYNMKFYLVIFISLVTFLLSRWLIFRGMQTAPNPAMVHAILNTSVLVTLVLSLLLLGARADFCRILLGILFILVGTIIIQFSIH